MLTTLFAALALACGFTILRAADPPAIGTQFSSMPDPSTGRYWKPATTRDHVMVFLMLAGAGAVALIGLYMWKG